MKIINHNYKSFDITTRVAVSQLKAWLSESNLSEDNLIRTFASHNMKFIFIDKDDELLFQFIVNGEHYGLPLTWDGASDKSNYYLDLCLFLLLIKNKVEPDDFSDCFDVLVNELNNLVNN